MKKFLLFFITVVITAAVTACICVFVIPKGENKTGNQNNVASNNQVADNNQNNNIKYEEIVAKYDNEDDNWIKNGKGTKVAFSGEIDDAAGLSITSINNNSDGTYTIKGVLYKQYEFTEAERKELEEKGTVTIYGEKFEKSMDDYGNSVLRRKAKKEEYPEFHASEDGKYLYRNTQWGACYRIIKGKHMQITLDGDTLVLGRSEMEMEEGTGTTVAELYNTMVKYSEFDDESGTKEDVRLFNFVFKNNKCIELYSIPFES